MKTFLVIILIIALFGCSNHDREVEYYPNGQVKFEVSLKNGKRHGKATGYFESGKLRGEVEYIDGKREGLWYDLDKQGTLLEKRVYHNNIVILHEVFNSGVLFGKTIYDSMGRELDFYQYKKNGERDWAISYPVFHTVQDTVRPDTPTTLFVRLGNADSSKINRGYLLITSALDSLRDNIPVDTLAQISSTNETGFYYTFKPTQKGMTRISGSIRFVDLNDSIVYGPRPFQYEFMVR